MDTYYNIHGLPLKVTSSYPPVSNLIKAELRHFRVSKPVTGALQLQFKIFPKENGKPYSKDFLRKNFTVARHMNEQYFRRNLIRSVTDVKKRKVDTLITPEPRLFPDPAYYFCVSEPLSPWLKKKGSFFLHAGCVAKNGKGLLIIGSSGAGKSTLTLSAIRSGFKFLSDEQPLLSFRKKEIIAHAFPRRIRIDRLPAALFPELRPVLKSSKAERLVFDAQEIWPESLSEKPCTPTILIFPNFKSGSRLQLKKIHSSKALGRLMQDDYMVWYQDGPWKNISYRHLELLQHLAANTRAFEMTYSVRDISKIPSVFTRLLHE